MTGTVVSQVQPPVDHCAVREASRHDGVDEFSENLVSKVGHLNYEKRPDMDQAIQALISRIRSRQSQCIVGEDNTFEANSLVDELAYRIFKGDVPEDLRNWEIVRLDIANVMLSGQEISKKIDLLRRIFSCASKKSNVIIFVNDAAPFFTFADCLKKCLQDRMPVIMTLSRKEYQYVSDKDPALFHSRIAEFSLNDYINEN